MRGSPLDRPQEVFRPFTPEETGRLRGFVADVRRLGDMSFFGQVPHQASVIVEEGSMSHQMDEPEDEAVRAAITQFRQIYSHGEPNSFRKTMKLLKRSAHEKNGPERDAAIDLLDGHLQAERDALNAGVGIGITFEGPTGSRKMDSRTIIDAYVHGHYLHSGNEKSILANQLDDLKPLPRYWLYTSMLTLRNVYWNAANATDRVLGTPELLDADVAT